MLARLVYLVFIMSAAFASVGILLSARLKTRYKSAFLPALLYYQVFVFTFGFYGIWGQVLLKVFLSDYVPADTLQHIFEISGLLGLPFLVFAWLMQLRFSLEITGRNAGKWLILWFLLLNFSIIFGVGIYSADVKQISPTSLVRYYFIGFNFVYSLLSSMIIIFSGRRKMAIYRHEAKMISYLFIVVMAAQCISLYLYAGNPWIGIAFIFLFFGGNAIAPVYLSYGAPSSMFMIQPPRNISFEEFCSNFEISPRESDIIREICNGLSNKEISEKLFISLQTVKDHTHRIYIKTNVKSRAQLMNLVREIM